MKVFNDKVCLFCLVPKTTIHSDHETPHSFQKPSGCFHLFVIYCLVLLKPADLISDKLVDVLILGQEIAPAQPSLCPHGSNLLRGLMEKKAHTFNQRRLRCQKICNSLHWIWRCLIHGFMLDIPFLCRAT